MFSYFHTNKLLVVDISFGQEMKELWYFKQKTPGMIKSYRKQDACSRGTKAEVYVCMYVRLKKKIKGKCFEEIRVTIAVALLSRKKSVCYKERNISIVKEEVLLKF